MNWQTELQQNALAYRQGNRSTRLAMAKRAIYFASLTIHTSWSVTIVRWLKGAPPALPAAKVFLSKRLGKMPEDWQGNKPIPKAQFARALLGFKNAGTIDVHMQRHYPLPIDSVVNTLWQWHVWLENLYPRNREQVQKQHAEVLSWVRTGIMP
jgi:hypothetical protein